MVKLILTLGVVIAAGACAHSAERETEDGLLRVYPSQRRADAARSAAAEARTPVATRSAPVPQPTERSAELTAEETEVAVEETGFAAVEAEANEAPALVGSLAIQVKGARLCVVRVDEQALGRAPVTADNLEPGKRVVTVKCPKRPSFTRVIEIRPGEAADLRLSRKDFVRGKKRRGDRRS